MISFCPFNSQIRKSEKQKKIWREKWGIRQESTVSRIVDLTNNGIVNHYLRDVDHGSTVSSETQDSIFHIHVRLDIWRCRTTRINMRLNGQHRKAMNSNGNQVSWVFSRTQWECICSSVMKLTDLILFQTSHSPLTIDTETLGLSITGEKYTVVLRQHLVTCSCSPSLPLCSVVRCFKAYVLFFLKKKVRHRKNMKNSTNRWELKINKDGENPQSLWF